VELFHAWYRDCFDDELNKDKICRLFKMIATSFQGSDLTEAIANFQLDSDPEFKKKEKDRKNKVIITTVHQSKGLEFPIVIVPCLNDAGMPWFLAKTPDEFEEECRCLYVAVTRCKEELYLSATLSLSADIEPEEIEETEDKEALAKLQMQRDKEGRQGRLSRYLTKEALSLMDVIDVNDPYMF
jgi:superfamily I DNA/RNA helicase